VLKPGRTLTVCEIDVVSVKEGKATACAHGLQTLMCLMGRPDRS
jgi:acyl-coenzyme A thioesterase PaaI-like protein